MKLLPALVVAAATLLSTSAFAQNVDAIQGRKALLKEFGTASRPIGAMLRGQEAFDLATVQASLAVYVANSAKLPALFPPDSKTGADTEALPVIWERKAEFEALFKKVGDDAKAAQAAVKDEASFKATVPALFRTCNTCHDTFRVKK